MHSLLPYNTFAVDVQAQDLIIINEHSDLTLALYPYRDKAKLIIGWGSNMLLVRDRDGLAIINQIYGRHIIAQDSDTITITLWSGENWHDTVMRSVQQWYRGIENLALIPGTVGAAPIQNIGAYGAEVSSVIASVRYYNMEDGKYYDLTHAQCQFAYRDSIFKHDLKGKALITSVTIQLSKSAKPILNYGWLAEKVQTVPYFKLSEYKDRVDIQLRHNVACIIKHCTEEKYLFIREKDSGKTTMVAGGIEDGEDVIQAWIREIIEETWYIHISFNKIIIPEIHFSFYNPRKDINRYGIVQVVAYTLVNEEHQMPEDPNIEAIWLDQNKIMGQLEYINKYCFAMYQWQSVQPEWRARSEKIHNDKLWIVENIWEKIFISYELWPQQIADAVIQIRSSKLPDWTQVGTAGSFFKNPIITQEQLDALLLQFPECPHRDMPNNMYKVAAWWILDHALWYKGKDDPNSPAWCRHNQALVLVNHGWATGQQIRDRAQHLMSECRERLWIILEPEVNIL